MQELRRWGGMDECPRGATWLESRLKAVLGGIRWTAPLWTVAAITNSNPTRQRGIVAAQASNNAPTKDRGKRDRVRSLRFPSLTRRVTKVVLFH